MNQKAKSVNRSIFCTILLSFFLVNVHAQEFESVYMATTGNVSFQLEKIKPIGNELHFYLTLSSLEGEVKTGLGSGHSGKIANIIDEEGNTRHCDKMALGDKRTTPYLDRIDVGENSPKPILLIATGDDVAKLTHISEFRIPTEKQGTAILKDITVPFNNDPYPWEENTAEFADRIYIKLDSAIIAEKKNKEVLKVPFQVLNESNTSFKFLASGSALRIIDTTGKEHKSYYIVHNDKKDHYTAHYYFQPDSVFSGHFIFHKPEAIEEIDYFELRPYSGNNIIRIESLD